MKEIVMMIFYLVIFVFMCLFIGRTTINMSPFSIHMENWRTVVAVLLFMTAYHLWVSDLKQDWRRELIEKVNSEETVEESVEQNPEPGNGDIKESGYPDSDPDRQSADEQQSNTKLV